VREQHKINAGDVYRKVVPVHKPQLFQALKEPAIHEEFFFGGFYEVFGAGDGAGSAEKVDEDFVVHVF